VQRGILKHYAHVLPQIFCGRILWGPGTDGEVSDDWRALAAWREGQLTIDMMRGTCIRDRRSVETLWVAGELQAWLASELRKQNDPPTDVAAELEVVFAFGKRRREGSHTLECTATISSNGRTFVDRYVDRYPTEGSGNGSGEILR
jgi:hypothetical protein